MPKSNVRRVNGVEITGTPTAGQVPVAIDGTSAAWDDAPVDVSSAVILAPASAARNTVTPTGDFAAITLKGQAGQTNPIAQVKDSTSQVLLNIGVVDTGTRISAATAGSGGTAAIEGSANISPFGGTGGVGIRGSGKDGYGGFFTASTTGNGVGAQSAGGNSAWFKSSDASNAAPTVQIDANGASTADLLSVAGGAGGFDKDGNLFAANFSGGGGGVGTVTSVALTVPSEFSVSGSPVTTSGTLAVSKANQSANGVFAGPTSGGAAAPTFRALVSADIPNNAADTTGTASNVTGTVAAANGGTGQTTYTKGDLLTSPGGASLNKLGVGSDGQVLTADAASTNGVKWAAAAGGTETVNIETITGTRTLTVGTDSTYQVLLPSGASRTVNMVTTGPPATGSKFTIRNSSATNAVRDLTIQSGGTTIDFIGRGGKKTYIFDGTNWVGYSLGAGEGTSDIGTTLGRKSSVAYVQAVAIGDRTSTSADSSTAVGALATVAGTGGSAFGAGANVSSGTDSTAIGSAAAVSANDATALGGSTSVTAAQGIAIGRSAVVSAVGGIAKGFNLTVARAFEEAASASSGLTNARYSDYPYSKQTTNATVTEVFLGNVASNRLTLASGKAIGFRMNVVAYSTTDNIGRVWRIEGGLKNVGGTTSLIGTVLKTSIADDGGDSLNWDVTVTANDTNDALKVEVTGSTGKTINWTVRVDAVETQ